MRRRILFGGIKIIGYSDWYIEIITTPSRVSNLGDTVAIFAKATREVYWSDESITVEEGIPTISVSDGVLEGNLLTVGINTDTAIKTIIVTATFEDTIKSLELLQDGKTIASHTEWVISVSASPASGISAAGGTSTITTSASRVATWTDGSTTTETAIPSLSTDLGSINGNKLTLSANTTTDPKTATITATHEGVSNTCTVKQNADSISEYGNVTLAVGTISDIPASGGSATSTGSNATQVLTWVSGRTTTVYPTITEGTISNVASKGTAISNRTALSNITITATGQGNKTASATITPYQAENKVIALTIATGTKTLSYSQVGAGGGTSTKTEAGSHSITFKFSSNSTSTTAPSSTYGTTTWSTSHAMTASGTFKEINNSTGAVTVSSKGTTVSNVTTGPTVTVSWQATWTHTSTYGSTVVKSNVHSLTASPKQSANAADATSAITAYGTPSVSIGSGITAGGGSATVSHSVSNTRTYYYTSGSAGRTASEAGTTTISITANGNNRFSLSGNTLSHSTMGKNVTTDTCTITAVNKSSTGKTKTASVSVSNAKTSITYGNPSVSLSYGAKNAAKGTVSPTYSYSQARTQNYTSGSTETLSALTSGGTLAFSETTAHANASVNATSGVVSWDANQTTSARSVGITLTVTMNGKSGSKAATSTQSADAVSSTSWGNVTKGTITNATVGAGGGTGKATAGNGSQSYTQTWVSGRTTSGSNSISPSASSYSATASSKGTTESGTTTVGSKAVTWSGSGSKSASGTMYVYQAANKKEKIRIRISSNARDVICDTVKTSSTSTFDSWMNDYKYNTYSVNQTFTVTNPRYTNGGYLYTSGSKTQEDVPVTLTANTNFTLVETNKAKYSTKTSGTVNVFAYSLTGIGSNDLAASISGGFLPAKVN